MDVFIGTAQHGRETGLSVAGLCRNGTVVLFASGKNILPGGDVPHLGVRRVTPGGEGENSETWQLHIETDDETRAICMSPFLQSWLCGDTRLLGI